MSARSKTCYNMLRDYGITKNLTRAERNAQLKNIKLQLHPDKSGNAEIAKEFNNCTEYNAYYDPDLPTFDRQVLKRNCMEIYNSGRYPPEIQNECLVLKTYPNDRKDIQGDWTSWTAAEFDPRSRIDELKLKMAEIEDSVATENSQIQSAFDRAVAKQLQKISYLERINRTLALTNTVPSDIRFVREVAPTLDQACWFRGNSSTNNFDRAKHPKNALEDYESFRSEATVKQLPVPISTALKRYVAYEMPSTVVANNLVTIFQKTLPNLKSLIQNTSASTTVNGIVERAKLIADRYRAYLYATTSTSLTRDAQIRELNSIPYTKRTENQQQLLQELYRLRAATKIGSATSASAAVQISQSSSNPVLAHAAQLERAIELANANASVQQSTSFPQLSFLNPVVPLINPTSESVPEGVNRILPAIVPYVPLPQLPM